MGASAHLFVWSEPGTGASGQSVGGSGPGRIVLPDEHGETVLNQSPQVIFVCCRIESRCPRATVLASGSTKNLESKRNPVSLREFLCVDVTVQVSHGVPG